MALLGIVGGLSRHAARRHAAGVTTSSALTSASHSENTNHFLKEASYRAHFIGLQPGAIAQTCCMRRPRPQAGAAASVAPALPGYRKLDYPERLQCMLLTP
jgi:hypothetical protein